jgi:neutral/alkaline ceramidase-like enzyme
MQRVIVTIGTIVLLTTVLLGPAAAELKVGVARADITPPIGGKMAGYSARGNNLSTGVHDPLSAQVLVVDDQKHSLALVALDLIGLPSEALQAVRDKIKQRTQADLVLIVCSHTHSGPDGSPSFPSQEKPWLADAIERIVEAAVRASDARVPATYAVAKGEAREGHNRRKVNPDGSATMFWRNEKREPTSPVDYEVGVIHFRGLDGKPLATLVNFTCHPVVLGPENLLISADYPGVMRSVVEKNVGGTCLFANGACGDINPFMDKSDPAEGAYEEMEKMGRAIGEEVVRVVRDMKMHEPGEGKLTLHSQVVPIEPRWDFRNPEVTAALEKRYGKSLVQAYLSRFKLPMSAELTTVTLGDDLAIVGLPGEFFVEHGRSLKARCVIPNTFLFGYCNGSLGYFPTINAAWQGGYGASEATMVEVGAGEKLINRALVNLYYQTGRLQPLPKF